jgi:hypothetical protein
MKNLKLKKQQSEHNEFIEPKKPLEPKKPFDEDEDDYDLNFVQIGNVLLQSKKLSIHNLKKNAIDIIDNKKVKPYLKYLQKEDTFKNYAPHYIG